jgi:hypothetical protein
MTGLVMLLMLVIAAGAYAEKKPKNDAGRLLTGRVTNHANGPLTGAVVYLSNTRTHAVKTFISGQEGEYRFPALSPNIDYEVYAQFNGKKSDTKTISQFDDRPQVNINLKVDDR